jgi:hypothetical protein
MSARRIHIVTDYGIEGWVPERRGDGALVALVVMLALAAVGVAGWLIGLMQATELFLG